MKVNGQLIRFLREQRGWSQEQLASAAGLGPRTIQRAEREGTASRETCLCLAATLESDMTALASIEVADVPARCPRQSVPSIASTGAAFALAGGSVVLAGWLTGAPVVVLVLGSVLMLAGIVALGARRWEREKSTA